MSWCCQSMLHDGTWINRSHGITANDHVPELGRSYIHTHMRSNCCACLTTREYGTTCTHGREIFQEAVSKCWFSCLPFIDNTTTKTFLRSLRNMWLKSFHINRAITITTVFAFLLQQTMLHIFHSRYYYYTVCKWLHVFSAEFLVATMVYEEGSQFCL